LIDYRLSTPFSGRAGCSQGKNEKNTTKEPISIQQQSIQALAPTAFDSAATAGGFD
jgi:hypothetical protein